ncbi:MAG: hypothetical protein AAFY82_03545 [Pseudomonadota bacterium]
MIRPFVIAAAALALSGPALAGTAFTAKLEVPKDRLVKIVAADALWKCVDDTCTATLERKAVKVSTCQQVAKNLGAVSAFESDQKALSDANLQKCNAVAKS